jgi:hypothetical protein
MPTTEPFSSHCLSFSWGENAFNATSIKRSASSAVEVDVTHMESKITSDPQNTDRKMIWKEVESSVVEPGEVAIEFFAVSTQMYALPEAIGWKQLLTVTERDLDGNDTGNVLVSYQAILTKVDLDAAVGEFVRGSATFKLSGYKE